jgi:hypothetical protein
MLVSTSTYAEYILSCNGGVVASFKRYGESLFLVVVMMIIQQRSIINMQLPFLRFVYTTLFHPWVIHSFKSPSLLFYEHIIIWSHFFFVKHFFFCFNWGAKANNGLNPKIYYRFLLVENKALEWWSGIRIAESGFQKTKEES